MGRRFLEKSRFSLLSKDLSVCIVCGTRKEEIHEVFYGRNRNNSMIYGCCVPLCRECHREIHRNKKLDNYYKQEMQRAFNKKYSNLDFLQIFRRNYLEEE